MPWDRVVVDKPCSIEVDGDLGCIDGLDSSDRSFDMEIDVTLGMLDPRDLPYYTTRNMKWRSLLIVILATFVLCGYTRYYWPTNLTTYAQQGTSHTHIQLSGYVTYVASESDGDYHIRVCDSPSITGMDVNHCVIGECVPALPCSHPSVGRQLHLKGVSRLDSEHHWMEVHPVEQWSYL